MHCEHSLDHLTSFVHHELSLAENDAMQRHLAVCDSCRGELQEQTIILRALRQSVPVEPSARARRQLQRQIVESLDERHKKPKALDHTPHWRLVTPPPQPLLGYSPSKAPPPSLDSSESAPRGLLEHTHSPVMSSSAHASNRLLTGPRRDQTMNRASSVLIWATFAMLLAVALFAVAIAIKPQQADTSRIHYLAFKSRLEERNAAQIRGRQADTLITTQIPLGTSHAATGTLHILPHHDPATGETFMVAYRNEDLERLKQDPQIDQSVFAAMLEGAIRVDPVDEKYQLPRDLLERYIGAEYKLTVLNLDRRIEVWAAGQFEKYRSHSPAMPSAPLQPRNGLPPLKLPD